MAAQTGQLMSLDEHGEGCVYCDGHRFEPRAHDPECPFETGLWPVIQIDVDAGLSCLGCPHGFVLGETYVLGEYSIEGVATILCLSCAAAATILDL